MRRRVVLSLAALLWVGASGAARGTEAFIDPSPGTASPVPKEVWSSCSTIAAILAVYPTLAVGTSPGPVQGRPFGPDRDGCRVRAAGPARGLVGEVPPEVALRDLMGQLGWKEDHRHAASGPGTASFALWNGKVFCRFGAGAISGTGDGSPSDAGTYALEAGCGAEPGR